MMSGSAGLSTSKTTAINRPVPVLPTQWDGRTSHSHQTSCFDRRVRTRPPPALDPCSAMWEVLLPSSSASSQSIRASRKSTPCLHSPPVCILTQLYHEAREHFFDVEGYWRRRNGSAWRPS